MRCPNCGGKLYRPIIIGGGFVPWGNWGYGWGHHGWGHHGWGWGWGGWGHHGWRDDDYY